MNEPKPIEHKKSSKIGLSVILLILCAAFASWGIYFYERMGIVQKLEHKLATSVDKRSQDIISYISTMANHGIYLAEQAEVQAAIEKFASIPAKDLSSPEMQQFSKRLTAFLEAYSTEESFRNSIFVTKQGTAVFSDYAQEYVGKNFTDDTYKNTALGESFLRALMSLSTDISDFAYDPVLNRVALFASVPIFRGTSLLGILVQEIDTEKIYSIVQNYIGLGRTGDVLLGKRVPEGTLYISKSRDRLIKPFKHFIYYNRIREVQLEIPLVQATSARKGTGIDLDRTGEPVVAGWQFVPIADWGLVAQIDLTELYSSLAYLLYISCFLLFLLVFTLIASAYRHSWIKLGYHATAKWLESNRHVFVAKLGFFLVLALCTLALFVFYSMKVSQALENEKERSVQKIADAKASLTYKLTEYGRIGQTLAYDYYSRRVTRETLIDHLKEVIAKNPSLFDITVAFEPYAYDPTVRLYAPDVHRGLAGGIDVEYLQESYDYTKSLINPIWDWYVQGLKSQETTWFPPYFDARYKQTHMGYSLPFFAPEDTERKKPIGVINILLDVTNIQDLMARVDVDTKGRVFLFSQDGTFVYYPLRGYIEREKTIYDLAREQSNDKLIDIAHDALAGKSGWDRYLDFTSGEQVWTYFVQEPITKWALGIVLSEKEVQLPPLAVRHYYMFLIFLSCITLCALLWLLGGFFLSSAQQYANIMIVIFLIGLGSIYYVIRAMPMYGEEGKLVVTDPIAVKQFEFSMDNYAKQVNENPSLKVPTGIYIYSGDVVSSTVLAISGYIWQKFDKSIDKNWIQAPQLPQAIEEVHTRKIYEVEEGDQKIVGWFFSARITQKFDYSKYPLDLLTARIDIEYADLSKNVTLVPSLEDYTDYRPESLPGIGIQEGLVFPTFAKKRTFFALTTETEDTNVGIKAYSNISRHVYLSYNIALIRYILYDFIVLILPLLLVFFSLYTIFVVGQRDKTFTPITALGAYTGLVFTAIILHGTFRSRQETNQLLYIEYLFFMLYITFILLVIHSLLRMYTTEVFARTHKLFDFFRIFFWPIQLIVFTLITMVVFYTR